MARRNARSGMSDRYAPSDRAGRRGVLGQARLAAASVLVVGAGGLGCPVLQYLAGAGVGRMIVVDHDTVEETNLHRQPLYAMADIGKPKAEAARAALLRFNPGVAIETKVERLTPQNVGVLIGDCGPRRRCRRQFRRDLHPERCLPRRRQAAGQRVGDRPHGLCRRLLRRRPELSRGLSRRVGRGRHLRHGGRAGHGRRGAGRRAGASRAASSAPVSNLRHWAGSSLSMRERSLSAASALPVHQSPPPPCRSSPPKRSWPMIL